jgi:tetratricopeptide (TPR) repeat protein
MCKGGSGPRLVTICLSVGLLLSSSVRCVPARKSPAGGGAPAIAFIEDDYPRALAEARARKLPLFVDAWAPWCHTCLSLRAYVLPDPGLRRFGGRFVWLSIDTERDSNAPAVDKLDVHVLPTLFVIDPANEERVVAWPGSLTASELAGWLDDAETAFRRRDLGGAAEQELLSGHRASAAGRLDDAIAAYRAAIAASPPGWPKRSVAVDALVTRLSDAQRLAECVTVAAEEAPHLAAGTALADVLRSGMTCADALPADAREPGRRLDLARLGERVAADPSQPILADDRSDLYDYVVEAFRGSGQVDEAASVARAWVAFLETEARRAPTPRERTVFDAHRLLAYRAIGEPERAISMLEASERDFPDDYNPPARLATAYLDMKRYDEALAAVKRALVRAYGPRKLRIWSIEADILQAQSNIEGARSVLREALDYGASIPLNGGYEKLRDAMGNRLRELLERGPSHAGG